MPRQIDLHKRAARLMQKLTGPDQRSGATSTIDTILEREMRIADRLHELRADDRQRVDGSLPAIVAGHLLMNARVTRHLVVRVTREYRASRALTCFRLGFRRRRWRSRIG